jgi:hypothetical protein
LVVDPECSLSVSTADVLILRFGSGSIVYQCPLKLHLFSVRFLPAVMQKINLNQSCARSMVLASILVCTLIVINRCRTKRTRYQKTLIGHFSGLYEYKPQFWNPEWEWEWRVEFCNFH